MNYDNQFTANPENELRTYALSLPNGPANYEMTLQPASTKIRTPPPNPPAMAGPRHGHPIDGLYSCDWAAADPNNGVARVTLDLKTDSTAGHFRKFRHAMVLDFTNNPAEGFQAYFLPWDGRGGAVHMTLPAGGHRHFFTAALSGCSVMVAGAPNNPTVYHAGVDSWENSPYTQDPHSNATPVANITPQLW
ncbi:MAG: hypothetical protein ACYTEK_23540, partial [Planctomycetota bacterium]